MMNEPRSVRATDGLPLTERLIDVHCNWLGQYVSEISTFGPVANAVGPEQLKRLDGYMTATSTALLYWRTHHPAGSFSQTRGVHLET